VRNREIDLRDVERAAKALADGTRLRILALLAGGEVCVCHIHESLGLPQSKVSRHLAYLRRAGLVNARKQGLWVYYTLADHAAPINLVLSSVSHCLGHVQAIQRDRKRLEAKTGCHCALPGVPLAAACCGTAQGRTTPSSNGS
jgi:ArsR family transcriptional regulator